MAEAEFQRGLKSDNKVHRPSLRSPFLRPSPGKKYDYFQGPVVQSPISANPGLTLNKTYGVNLGLALIGL